MKKFKNKGNAATLKKVLHEIGRYRFLLFISTILAALTVFLQLYIPFLFGDAIDALIGKGRVDFGLVAEYSKYITILIVLNSVLTWVMNTMNNRLTYSVVRNIRAKAIRRIQKLPLSYLDSHSTGDVVGRVIADCDQFSDGLLMGLTQLFTGVVTIVVTLVFMIRKSWQITLIVVVLTPVTFLVARFIARRSYSMFRKQAEARGDETGLINEMVGNQRVVQAFGYGKTASERFEKINTELQEYSQKAIFYSSLTNPCTRAVNSVIYAFVALVGAQMILIGRLTVGGLSVLLTYANQYMKPFNDISSVVTELQNALACADRIFELIEEPAEVEEKPEELGSIKGKIKIKDLAFSYDKDKELIKDFNLDVTPGMRVAIVGPTGCGKTTLINLLMRFYETDAGSIQVDDRRITDVTRHSLRRNYGMVLQETWLRNGTVRENIAFGRPEATDEEIIAAAKEAHSWEFIRRMPQKLDTVITDSDMSQGEKQLLCITRVMLCHPQMLILDEATSSIDTRTELKIQSAFDKLMNGHTSFIVAHRLSTIRTADVILVMKDGKIVEQGNHDSLLKEDGFYSKLYHSQFEGVEA